MKRFSLLLLAVALFIGALPIAARAYWEPPHFTDPPDAPADCETCHISSPHHGLASYPSGLNELCESCHFDGGPATGVLTHSSRTTDNGYGDWDLDCWSCHNQHGQEQELYWTPAYTYGKYIRRYMERPPIVYGQIKEIDPLDPGPYYEPLSILREVTSTVVEYGGPAWFVDGDGAADDDICQVCHDLTLYYNTGTEMNFHADYGSDSQPGGTCTACHRHDDGFRASGHGATDFAWTDTTKASCGTESCHDWANNTNVVAEVHNSTCLNCHDNPFGGNGTAIDRDVGFATNGGTAPPHNEECTVCHTLVNGHTHHDRSDSYAANATCTQCHTDPRVGTYDISAQAQQLACRACHVQYSGSTMQIIAIEWAKEGSADATGTDAGNDYRPIIAGNGKKFGGTFTTDHTFNNHNGTDETDAIDNYGICFECHGTTGRTGYAAATNPSPYHALPAAGSYNSSQSVNTIGGNGWSVDNVGNNDGNTGSQFRGGVPWDPTNGYDAYWPIGKDRINLGYAQHSLAKGATNAVVYKNQNDITAAYSTIAAGLVFGIQTVDHLGGSNTFAVPHFDSICNSGSTIACDNITGISVTKVTSQGATLGFDVSATSSDSALMHVTWGGIEIGTIAGTGTINFRWRDNKDAALDQYYCMDQFNAGVAQPLWIISENGGAASASTPALRGSGVNDSATVSPTCTRIFTQPAW